MSFSFNLKISLFVLLLLPVLLRLGFWQLDRAAEKDQLKTKLEQRQVMVNLHSAELVEDLRLDGADDLSYRRATLLGKFDYERQLLLDNVISNGKPGYFVYTPFVTADAVFIINRGWLAGYPDRQLPEIPEGSEGLIELVVMLYLPDGEPITLRQDQWKAEYPLLVQSIAMDELIKLFGEKTFPMQAYLLDGFDGALKVQLPEVRTSAQKHMGYAVQWFAMATVLIGLWLYVVFFRGKN